MKRTLIFIICFVLLSVFIYKRTNVQSDDSTKFEIYLVADNTVSAIKNKNIDEIQIEENPIITDKDIEKYIWKEHRIVLTKESAYPQALSGASHKFFITVVDDKRIYLGVFESPASSLRPPSNIPLINMYSRDKSFSIIFKGDSDPRMDERVKGAFKRLRKLVD